MTAWPIPDHSREDIARRFRLLEMAGGDLKKAMELEQWVQCGLPPGVKPKVVVQGTLGAGLNELCGAGTGEEEIDLTIPPALRRPRAPNAA